MTKYFETLTETDRENLFAFMRQLDKEIERLEASHRQLSPSYGQVAVGAAHFDPWLRADTTREYLNALRKGSDPDDALAQALLYGRFCVAKHNKKRPKDINWQRWEDSAESHLQAIHRRTPKEEN